MIWAILWAVYLAIGCILVWKSMDEGVAAIRGAYPDASGTSIFVVAMFLLLTWPWHLGRDR